MWTLFFTPLQDCLDPSLPGVYIPKTWRPRSPHGDCAFVISAWKTAPSLDHFGVALNLRTRRRGGLEWCDPRCWTLCLTECAHLTSRQPVLQKHFPSGLGSGQCVRSHGFLRSSEVGIWNVADSTSVHAWEGYQYVVYLAGCSGTKSSEIRLPPQEVTMMFSCSECCPARS